MSIKSYFKKKKTEIIQATPKNKNEPLKTLVWYKTKEGGYYLMYMGTAIANKSNPLPVEEWFADHFKFKGEQGDVIFDHSAGLRYSNNFKFKFTPTHLPTEDDKDKSKNEIIEENRPTPEQEEDIYLKNLNFF